MMKNMFDSSDVQEVLSRVDKLNENTSPQWGTMNVSQMLAHCCVAYEMVNKPESYAKPSGLMKYIMKWMVKPLVVGPKPYKKNGRTAPEFVVSNVRDFRKEKLELINHINQMLERGESFYHNRQSQSFGSLTKTEWSNLFFKHIDHHLKQFGV